MIESVNEPMNTPDTSRSRTSGSQTLARGLEVLRMVANTPTGMAINEVAEHAGIHRTVAYRLLNTLCDMQLLHRGTDSRYRGAVGLLALGGSAYHSLRAAAEPVLRRCAEELGATVALIVREGDEAVALSVVAPSGGVYHISFAEASRHPLDTGAAGHAVVASAPALPGEDPRVTRARRDGFASTYGEVEPGMYGLAVPLPPEVCGMPACLNLITVREDLVAVAAPALQQAARALAAVLG